MKSSVTHETTRRAFLQACAAGLSATELVGGFGSPGNAASPEPGPVVRAEPDPRRALVPTLSWDTEGGERFHTNLLRKGTGLGLRVRLDGQRREGATLPTFASGSRDHTRYRLRVSPKATLIWEVIAGRDHLIMSFSVEGPGSLAPSSVEVVFPFDPMVTATTILPSQWNSDGSVRTPLVVSAPDFGQMLADVQPAQASGRLEGSRDDHIVDLLLELPQLDANNRCSITLTPVFLPEPQELQDKSLWRLARRAWFNAFQPTARWGEQSRAFSAPSGILANNVISDPCSLSLPFYADLMRWTPNVAQDISVANLVGRTVDFWLEQRTRSNGEVVGYWDYTNFLDANAGPIIASWDYVEATGELAWLEKRIKQLEFVADFYARRDQDFDGLVEATQSGNANTAFEPDRSSNWFDAVNYGYKDAYANAYIYRAWRCLADLESKLHREDQRSRYARLADRLKAAYKPSLYNPETGWIGCWRSADGKLHDYASPITNGMAIEYGLISLAEGKKIVENLWDKMLAVGFHRFELGIPPNLDPIHQSDYLQPDALGCPHREDGTDTFQQYENGGISAGHGMHFLAASYLVGQSQKADNSLRQMLERQQGTSFQNGVQNTPFKGVDWTTWDGKPCGYEGYLADVFYYLLAVLMREPHFRAKHYRPLAAA